MKETRTHLGVRFRSQPKKEAVLVVLLASAPQSPVSVTFDSCEHLPDRRKRNVLAKYNCLVVIRTFEPGG